MKRELSFIVTLFLDPGSAKAFDNNPEIIGYELSKVIALGGFSNGVEIYDEIVDVELAED